MCKELSKIVRKDILNMAYNSGASHIGSALSITDILCVLYKNVLKKDDHFVLSKGHSGMALYSVLARCGYFNVNELENYYKNGSKLSGHISHKGVNGVEISTGSLGHGVSIACGFALSSKLSHKNNKTYTVVGDGEINEGSFWEALLFASTNKLNNFTIIIDRNNLQAMGECNSIINTDNLYNMIKSFGFIVISVDGHNHEELLNAFNISSDKPKCIIANTIKGKGISFMENNNQWHYKNPSKEDYDKAMIELENI